MQFGQSPRLGSNQTTPIYNFCWTPSKRSGDIYSEEKSVVLHVRDSTLLVGMRNAGCRSGEMKLRLGGEILAAIIRATAVKLFVELDTLLLQSLANGPTALHIFSELLQILEQPGRKRRATKNALHNPVEPESYRKHNESQHRSK